MLPSAEDGGSDGRFQELYASAREARRRAQETVRLAEATHVETKAARELHLKAWARVVQVQELWLSGQREQMQYSALARLQARLTSMPVIEQAKGVLMAEYGWSQDEAFDTLRRASQRSNIRIRDLAAKIVASVASAPAQLGGANGRPAQERAVALLPARAAKAAARRPGRAAG